MKKLDHRMSSLIAPPADERIMAGGIPDQFSGATSYSVPIGEERHENMMM